MSIETVESATFMSDLIILIRDNIRNNVDDPMTSRPSNEKFVMTSYPRNVVNYPIITVVDSGTVQEGKLGMGSEGTILRLGIEIRIWGRNVKERDEIFNSIYDYLRTNQLSGDDITSANLHDFSMNSAVNISEGDIRVKVVEVTYLYLCI